MELKNKLLALLLCVATLLTTSLGVLAVDGDTAGEYYNDDASSDYFNGIGDDIVDDDEVNLTACSCGGGSDFANYDHFDTCSRKQYLLSLIKDSSGNYLSADALYALLPTLNYEDGRDMLDILSAKVATTYDTLMELIGTAPVGSADAVTGGGSQITLDGVAEGAVASAAEDSFASLEWSALNSIAGYINRGRELAFAYDISVSTAEGSAWQPAVGQYVTVTVDVPAKYADGTRLGILHEHDGVVESLGIFTVENGKLSFKTDGFSTFYGYTVDFLYNGTWYSISGGSSITLSELFGTLGISREVTDVTEVTFSDPSLISITPFETSDPNTETETSFDLYTEYNLTSLAPFETEEFLYVTFSNGDELVINVYDDINGNISTNQTLNHGDKVIKDCTITSNVTFTCNKPSSGNYSSIKFSGRIIIQNGATLTIKKADGNFDLWFSRSDGYTNAMFIVEAGGTLIIESNAAAIRENDKKPIVLGGGSKNFLYAKGGATEYEPTVALILLRGHATNPNLTATLRLKNVEFRNVFSNKSNVQSAAISTTFASGTDANGNNYKDTTYRVDIDVDSCHFKDLVCRTGTALFMCRKAGGTVDFINTVVENTISLTEINSDGYTTSGGTIRTNGGCTAKFNVKGCTFDNNKAGYGVGTVSKPYTGQYVRIEIDVNAAGHIPYLSEIQIFSGGTNYATSAQGATYKADNTVWQNVTLINKNIAVNNGYPNSDAGYNSFRNVLSTYNIGMEKTETDYYNVESILNNRADSVVPFNANGSTKTIPNLVEGNKAYKNFYNYTSGKLNDGTTSISSTTAVEVSVKGNGFSDLGVGTVKLYFKLSKSLPIDQVVLYFGNHRTQNVYPDNKSVRVFVGDSENTNNLFSYSATSQSHTATSTGPIKYTSKSTVTNLDAVNTATQGAGAAIYWNGGAGNMVIDNCTFTNNIATYRGGACFLEADTTITNTTFTSNKATGTTVSGAKRGGGAISMVSYGGGDQTGKDKDFTLTLDKTVEFKNNYADDGGAICYAISYTEDKNNGVNFNLVINGASFINNTAKKTADNHTWGRGGAILCIIDGNALVNNTDANVEKRYFNATLNLNSGTFVGNKADHGGAISIHNFNVTIGDTSENKLEMYDNSATNGGAMFITNDVVSDRSHPQTVKIIQCDIHNNNATEYGGALCIRQKNTSTNDNCAMNIDVIGGNITNNTAGIDGGGVYALAVDGVAGQVNIKMPAGNISSNTATQNGGGIYSSIVNGALTVSDAATISANTAQNGGGIYVGKGAMNVTGGIITKNNASISGGGVYVQVGTFTLAGTDIGLHSNTATTRANDLYSTGSGTTVVLPSVDKMNLAGWASGAKPTGWFADYASDDSSYPQALLGRDNPGRYKDNLEHAVEVKHATITANGGAYYNLTLGVPPETSGQVTIIKNVEVAPSEDQTFLFKLSGDMTDSSQAVTGKLDITVAVVIKAGSTSGRVTLLTVPQGNYTVTELGAWSWRYEQNGSADYVLNGSEKSFDSIQMGYEQTVWTVTLGNKLKNDKWLSHDNYVENKFDGTAD